MGLVPNFLSSMRLGLVPVLLMLAWGGFAQLFLVGLILSLATDAADGFIARRFKATSELGAKLDSWADFATYVVLPLCGWWLRPELIRAEATAIVTVVVFYLSPIVIGFLKYRRLTSYHTWLARACAIVAAMVILVFFAGGPGWPWRCFAPLVAISGIEEIAITAVLSEWRANVPSLWHALQIRRDVKATSGER